MVALFKDRSPANVVWLLVLSVVVHSHFYLVPPQVFAGNGDGLLSVFLLKYMVGVNPLYLILVYHLLVLIPAVRLNFLFNDQRMFDRSNFLTAMSYVLLTALLPGWNNISPALIVNILLIWFFVKIVRLYNHPNPKTLLFNLGLIIGVSVLLYHPTALLVLVAMFALFVVRPFNATEGMVLVMGIAAPYYFFGAYLFLSDRFHLFTEYLPQWSLNLPGREKPVILIIAATVVFLITIAGIYSWQNRSRRMLIQVRKNWGVLLVMLLVMLPVPFINKGAGFDSLLLWIVPLSPFMGKAFSDQKKKIVTSLIFWAMMILVVLNNWILTKN